MSSPDPRRRRSSVRRKSHSIHVDEAVWQAVGVLVELGLYASYSEAAEKGFKALLGWGNGARQGLPTGPLPLG